MRKWRTLIEWICSRGRFLDRTSCLQRTKCLPNLWICCWRKACQIDIGGPYRCPTTSSFGSPYLTLDSTGQHDHGVLLRVDPSLGQSSGVVIGQHHLRLRCFPIQSGHSLLCSREVRSRESFLFCRVHQESEEAMVGCWQEGVACSVRGLVCRWDSDRIAAPHSCGSW